MHYLITGHTGFKGTWLSWLLVNQGHTVSGISLDPDPGSIFDVSGITKFLENDLRLDIRNSEAFEQAVAQIKPDVAMHLAAQPIVKRSYEDPRFTMETNVNGTLNFLESTEQVGKLRARVVVTSDKVYRNKGKRVRFTENDPLGGKDPYSASKSMADILTQSWMAAHPKIPTAIVRAGNVIGGGDVSEHRLVPDLVKAFREHQSISLRFPGAVRPWQHVLDCVSAYLRITDDLLSEGNSDVWNVGPNKDAEVPVRHFVEQFSGHLSRPIVIKDSVQAHLHEDLFLALDSKKIRTKLGWSGLYSFSETVAHTARWAELDLHDAAIPSLISEEIEQFLSRSRSR